MIEISIFLIGAIIALGFLGNYLFERTKIPDILLLIAVGMLIGPVLKIADPAVLVPLAPLFGAVALIIILFDGGLNLNLFKVLGELAPATLFTVLAFLAAATATALVLSVAFGWNLAHAALLGIILGGTASNVVIPIIGRISTTEEVKTLLSLESAINDTLTIVGTIALMEVMATQSLNLQNVSNAILGAFAIAGVAGIFAGFAWIKALSYLHEKSFGYMLTLSALFILYAGVEAVKANGAIAVLAFGLILGSSNQLQRLTNGNQQPLSLEGPLKVFHTEISFFIRTFFFVYTGVILDIGAITGPIALLSMAVLVALFVSRRAIVEAFSALYPRTKPYKMLMSIMMPKGLAAAVLLSVPASKGIRVFGFEEIGLTALILTNVLATAGIYFYERKNGKPPEQSPTDQPAKPRVVLTKSPLRSKGSP